jgi:hypothetical protein
MSRVVVLSDIHYAGPQEQARGGLESSFVANPLLRALLMVYRDRIWLKSPMAQNHLLNQFFTRSPKADLVIANGDFSCDSAAIGLSDDASFESAGLCLEILRTRLEPSFKATFGDHEFGKMSIIGGRGGLRFRSYERAVQELNLEPLWDLNFGRWRLVGVASSILALPAFLPEILESEKSQWLTLRQTYISQLEKIFESIDAGERIILFCHDPTALPFLREIPAVASRISAIEKTVIGHLHSEMFLWKSRLLAGVPEVRWAGNTVRRYSAALNRARRWKAFNVILCPALAGIQLFNDGGFLVLDLPDHPTERMAIQKIPIRR